MDPRLMLKLGDVRIVPKQLQFWTIQYYVLVILRLTTSNVNITHTLYRYIHHLLKYHFLVKYREVDIIHASVRDNLRDTYYISVAIHAPDVSSFTFNVCVLATIT